jgi:DNA-binding transcriptional LysR family regulator
MPEKKQHYQMKIENMSDLAVLIHTARTGSLTKAAAVMSVTPAAASAMLKRLETQLGTRLIERSTRALRLTAHGQTLLEYANRAFELVAEGEAQVTEDQGELEGTIRVAAPSDLTRAVLLAWFDEFLISHPRVHLSLFVGDRVLDVIRDEVDLAIRYGELVDSQLVVRPLGVFYPIVTAAPSYLARHGIPTSPQELEKHNCVMFGRGGRTHRLWKFEKDGQWEHVRVNGDRSVDDASLAREWALVGAGILLKTPLEQRRDMDSGTLVRLLEDWQTEPYPLNALLPSGRFLPKRVRVMVDFLSAKFQSTAS